MDPFKTPDPGALSKRNVNRRAVPGRGLSLGGTSTGETIKDALVTAGASFQHKKCRKEEPKRPRFIRVVGLVIEEPILKDSQSQLREEPTVLPFCPG